jgi:hypothetical protein
MNPQKQFKVQGSMFKVGNSVIPGDGFGSRFK